MLNGSLDAGLVQVERRLLECVSQTDAFADKASRHLAEAGGKRVRPTLTLLASYLGEPDDARVIEAAVAVELTHLATLYHDDVMDSAPMRRGVPAAHKLWGNSVAILTGDLLFAQASLVVAELGPEAVKLQAKTFERLCLGQIRETVGPKDDEDAVMHYISVLADKTGSLIAASAHFGALYAGCSLDVIESLVTFGEKVGVAFQLADDVIDLKSSGAESGKTPGTDLREGVPTLPVLLARRDASAGDAQAQAAVALVDADLSTDAALGECVEALRRLPALQEAQVEAQRWANEALEALEPLPEGPAKSALVAYAHQLVDRIA